MILVLAVPSILQHKYDSTVQWQPKMCTFCKNPGHIRTDYKSLLPRNPNRNLNNQNNFNYRFNLQNANTSHNIELFCRYCKNSGHNLEQYRKRQYNNNQENQNFRRN